MKTETLNLNTSRGATTAFVARPDTDATAAVILIQEWWGINDHIRDLAGRYAKEGYQCVAPDLYRGKIAKNQDEASKLMHALAIEDGMETISRAIEETKRTYNVRQVGITGHCMGGTFALRAACEIIELAAAAPFYGDIPEENVLAKLKVPTLFIAGNRDSWITPEKVNGLREVARKYNLPVEVVSYDADHAFFNDTRPEVYNAEAAADAWRRVSTRVVALQEASIAVGGTNGVKRMQEIARLPDVWKGSGICTKTGRAMKATAVESAKRTTESSPAIHRLCRN